MKDLQEEIKRLNDTIDYWQSEYEDLNEQLEDANNQIDNLSSQLSKGIKDIDNFIWRLKVDNLYTEEITNFITYYLKYYNK